MDPIDYRTQVFTVTADAGTLNDHALLSRCVDELITVGNFTRIDGVSHQFKPQGITMVALLSESHIALHTWPERQTAKFVVATCQNDPVPSKDLQRVLQFHLKASRILTSEINS
ncbi:MAG: S-adenosylmethionine decarboxylase [Patescibacteria group bacterium]|jgi:S-adenosylmethionine/arginine decarboxylase-like enzyme|nr:S-adenosylmethionine decarboxylase [Patescibacteria group bacterium]